MTRKAGVISAVMVLLLGVVVPFAGATDLWRELESGLEIARFDTRTATAADDGDLVILRVDPQQWKLRVLTNSGQPESSNRTLSQWCHDYDLVAAINAGMFQADMRTHVGYLKVDGRLINGFVNDYLSAVAFDPVDPADPPFRIFDLDEELLKNIKVRYKTVVQNLRLVKRSGINRWQPSRDKWPEAALGEDTQGHALLIYCSTAMSMHKFNKVLLSLSIGLAAAQHLEGNTAAQFMVNHPLMRETQIPGDNFSGDKELPNILGVTRRQPPEIEPVNE